MHVQNKLQIYEINGSDVPVGKEPKLLVESHWSIKNRIVLSVGGKKITVIADDLRRAIDNATNARAF